jgi:hypothetical protein
MHSPKARFIQGDDVLFRSTPILAATPSAESAMCSRYHAVWRRDGARSAG